MRLIYLTATWLIMTVSLAQAGQGKGTAHSELDACLRANAAAILDMEIPPAEIACKGSKRPDCDDYVELEEFYTIEICSCTDRAPATLDGGKRDAGKTNNERWVCAVNYNKTPGKW